MYQSILRQIVNLNSKIPFLIIRHLKYDGKLSVTVLCVKVTKKDRRESGLFGDVFTLLDYLRLFIMCIIS